MMRMRKRLTICCAEGSVPSMTASLSVMLEAMAAWCGDGDL
jgi:hypothetical protein